MGAPGHGRGQPVRAGAHVRSDRSLPACQHRARYRQRRTRRIVDCAGGRGADRPAVRPLGRRPDHGRRRGPAPSNGGANMISSELHAAGVHDPALRDAYRRCRTLNSQHGRTFFLATRLLAPQQRPAVHALYGFARRADDILDDVESTATGAERAESLQRLGADLFNLLVEGRDARMDDDPVLTAVVHTARRYDIGWDLFDDFLASMRMDLTVTDYPDRAALDRYMYGSAEVIGLQMLPILGTVIPRAEAAPYAAALGKAF